MDIPDIIKKLEWHDGTFPRRALEEAIAQKEQITPYLLNILEEVTNNTKLLVERDDYMGHIYSMYLLAQFRERDAYPLIFDFFSIPGEVSLEVTGDVVTEDLKNILASVSRGDVSLIQALAENESANEYARAAALEALLCLVVAGEIRREEVIEYYKSLFHSPGREPSIFWDVLVSCCTDLYPEEVYEEIQEAFAEGLIDELFIDRKLVDERLALGKEKALAELQNRGYGLIEDTIAEMEKWAAFRQPQPQPQQQQQRRQPVVKKEKVGRNAPCPCGSGRKYKKCCGG